MSETKLYIVNEIFYSLQGEGYYTGTPAVFLRFAGCNRNCSFCDTDHNHGRAMTAAEIADTCAEYPTRHLVATGGEPLLQLDSDLLRLLKAKGFYVQIETNGSLPAPPEVDWVTCSPKDAPLGNRPRRRTQNRIPRPKRRADSVGIRHPAPILAAMLRTEYQRNYSLHPRAPHLEAFATDPQTPRHKMRRLAVILTVLLSAIAATAFRGHCPSGPTLPYGLSTYTPVQRYSSSKVTRRLRFRFPASP